MMDEYYTTVRRLPDPLKTELLMLDTALAPFIQEIRIRLGQPVRFTVKGRLTPCQKYLPQAERLRQVDAGMLRSCYLALCHHSSYAYEEQLQNGFFTLDNGCRVGVAGTWGPAGFAVVSSLDLRIARWVTCDLPGEIISELAAPRGGILVAGPPGSGKTTFLRSVIERLAQTDRIFCVVDERAELMAENRSLSCDIYTRYPRAKAIEMAIRCMNPQFIVCDEMGTENDAAALEQGIASGVTFIASVHCDSAEHLSARPQLKRLLEYGAFATGVFLDGRERPGTVAGIKAL